MATKDTNIEMDGSETPEPGETSVLAKVKASKGAVVLTQDETRRLFAEQAEEKRKDDAKWNKYNENSQKVMNTLPFRALWCTAIGILYSLSIAAIIIGSIYHKREDCSAEPIAITMIITGVIVAIIDINQVLIPLVRKLLYKQDTLPNNEENPEQQQRNEPTWKKCLFFVLAVLKFIGCIYAYIIVYGLYSNVEYNDKDNQEYYCDRTLYLVSFWILTIPFVIMGFFIIMLIFAICAGCCLASRN